VSRDDDLTSRLQGWAEHVGNRSARRDAVAHIDSGTRVGRLRILVLRVTGSVRDDGVVATADLIAHRLVARLRRAAA